MSKKASPLIVQPSKQGGRGGIGSSLKKGGEGGSVPPLRRGARGDRPWTKDERQSSY